MAKTHLFLKLILIYRSSELLQMSLPPPLSFQRHLLELHLLQPQNFWKSWSTLHVTDATPIRGSPSEQFFFWPFGRWSLSCKSRCTGYQGKVILDFYSVKVLVRWIVGRIGKLGRDVVKTLIIKFFMVWLSSLLIIRLFPLISLPWLSRISDTSENKPERLDSDNQINISRLISFLELGRGIQGLDDKSRVMEILMSEAFAKINPTDPLILAKQVARRKRKWQDSSGISLARSDASRVKCAGIINEESRHKCGLTCQLQPA